MPLHLNEFVISVS